jgi:hypothetical protein
MHAQPADYAGPDHLPAVLAELEDAESWEVTEVSAEGGEAAKPRWELKELKPLHKQVASLVAQGMKNVQVAALCNITPEYVSALIRQPLVKAHIAEMCEVVGVRLEALFEQSVEVIAETMTNGTRGEKLKAARLQMEATKRIGAHNPVSLLPVGATDRLLLLSERLLALQSNVRKGRTFDENGKEVSES